MTKGKFITFEGGEGSGKSTHIRFLKHYLDGLGIENIVCREPGGVVISEQIRAILMDKENKGMCSMSELLLFIASRKQVITELIEPNLRKGIWVLCDRYMDSAVVYQGHCRDLGMDTVLELHDIIIGKVIPDLTLYLDVDPTLGLSRVKGRNGEITRLDMEGLEFHERVREGYLKLCDMFPNRIANLNSNVSNDELLKEVIKTVHDRLIPN